MGRYITTKADFTLRRKHKKGSGVTIYETDYTTINPMPNAMKGEYVIGDSNFVFTSRLGINTQRKHVRGKFVQPPINGSSDETVPWTIDNMAISSITTETRVRLKPDYNSIKDFACYGSAEKLIQGTVNGVITDFPAEMYLGKSDLDKFSLYNWDAGYGLDETRGGKQEFMTFYNEYGIDITTVNVLPESVTNPLRYLTLCGTSYTYIVDGQEPIVLTSFSVSGTSSGYCYNGKDVWIDKLAEVELKFGGNVTVHVDVFKDNRTKEIFYGYSGGEPGAHIRPKKEIVEDYFMNCDDFTAVLLDRVNKPIYTATFETPRETDTGIIYDMVTYTWPSLLGGYNPDLSGPYYSYLESLMHLGEFLDEYYTDNMWRSLTHEAIKALDWTYVSNSDGEIEDLSKIDTSRIEPITKIYGRQFDDLKRYADGIKSINTITYNQRSNTPDYTLTDVLANSGWEIKTLKLSSDNELATESLYPGLTSGYTASDANNEFFRRLKLNSNYLFSAKGTRKGIDTILALLGLRPEEYKISEYVGVFLGNKDRYKHFCDKTEGKEQLDDCPNYPLAEDVATINRYKANFNSYDPYGAYCGIPVTEIGYWKGDEDFSYVVPWYSHGKTYDGGLYFQMNGGWGKREKMDINLEMAPNISAIAADNLYTETQARLKFAKNLDELLQQAHVSSNLNDVFYVTDLSDIETAYSIGWKDENLSAASHYFILENEKYNQFLGYSDEAGKYGWRSIEMSEITEPNTAGTLVLYMESIIDDTTGNNPHIGNGTYDDGMSYVSGMSEIFAYSILNKNFIGIDDETCDKIKDYYFDVEFLEDNRKSWFFSDNYNSGCGKTNQCEAENCEEKIYFREADVTDDVCNIKKTYEITELLNDETKENSAITIGLCAGNSFSTEKIWYKDGDSKSTVDFNFSEKYNRITQLIPFDPEENISECSSDIITEAAANSIVNIKNMGIEFYYPCCLSTELRPGYRKYIEDVVLFYLEQFIPSTTIFNYKIEVKDTWTDEDKKGLPCNTCNTEPDPVVPRPEPEPEPEPDPGPTPPGPGPDPDPPGPDDRITYKLFLSPLSKTIEYNGTVQIRATYKKYINGNEDTSATRDVTTDAGTTWTSTNNTLAPVNAGLVTGNNTDTEHDHQATIKATYSGTQQEEPSVITVKKKTETPPGPTPDPVITIKLAVITPIDATATTINYTATTYSDGTVDNTIGVSVKLSNGTTVNNNRVGTLSIPANTATSVKTWTVQAFCTDHTDKKDEKQVRQQPALFIEVTPELIKTGPTGATGLRASVKCNSAWTITSRPDWVSITTNNGGTGDKIVTFSANRLSDRTPTAGTINFQVTGRPDLTDSLTVQTIEPLTTDTTLVSHIECSSAHAIAQVHGLIFAPPDWQWSTTNEGKFGVAYHYRNGTGQTVSSTTLPPMAQYGEKCIIKLTTVSLSDELEPNFHYLKFTSGDGRVTWRSTVETFSSNAIAEEFNTWWENGGNYRNTEVFRDGVFEFY